MYSHCHKLLHVHLPVIILFISCRSSACHQTYKWSINSCLQKLCDLFKTLSHQTKLERIAGYNSHKNLKYMLKHIAAIHPVSESNSQLLWLYIYTHSITEWVVIYFWLIYTYTVTTLYSQWTQMMAISCSHWSWISMVVGFAMRSAIFKHIVHTVVKFQI